MKSYPSTAGSFNRIDLNLQCYEIFYLQFCLWFKHSLWALHGPDLAKWSSKFAFPRWLRGQAILALGNTPNFKMFLLDMPASCPRSQPLRWHVGTCPCCQQLCWHVARVRVVNNYRYVGMLARVPLVNNYVGMLARVRVFNNYVGMLARVPAVNDKTPTRHSVFDE